MRRARLCAARTASGCRRRPLTAARLPRPHAYTKIKQNRSTAAATPTVRRCSPSPRGCRARSELGAPPQTAAVLRSLLAFHAPPCRHGRGQPRSVRWLRQQHPHHGASLRATLAPRDTLCAASGRSVALAARLMLASALHEAAFHNGTLLLLYPASFFH